MTIKKGQRFTRKSTGIEYILTSHLQEARLINLMKGTQFATAVHVNNSNNVTLEEWAGISYGVTFLDSDGNPVGVTPSLDSGLSITENVNEVIVTAYGFTMRFAPEGVRRLPLTEK